MSRTQTRQELGPLALGRAIGFALLFGPLLLVTGLVFEYQFALVSGVVWIAGVALLAAGLWWQNRSQE